MKVCSSCGFPVVTSRKIITDVLGWILNQDFSDDVKVTKNPRSIIFTQGECRFKLIVMLKPMINAIEEWDTPFGSYKKNVANNRGVFDYLNKWYKILKRDEKVNAFEVMEQEGLIKLETVSSVCSVCRKKTSKPKSKIKKKPKTKKIVTVKEVKEGETLVAVDLQKAATLKKLDDTTLKELIAAAMEERIAEGEKKKITWKDIIKLYLEENVINTKKRHPEIIAELLDLGVSQVHEILEELEKEGVTQKEFRFFDYYILTKNYNSEMARKHLEILDYLKQHTDCPSTKCTQFSISLSFDLPFAIVGFILNAMQQNHLIKKESMEAMTNGVTRKIACYIPSSY